MLLINPELETNKIVYFIQQTVKQTGLKQVVLGWSGGIDSTVCLYLLAKAIPKENIHVLHLPYKDSFINELTDSKINELNIPKENMHEISIKTMVDEVWNKISQKLKAESLKHKNEENVRQGNIMARMRMIILFDFAKKINGLVCGTENKTEHLLGYFTRFGDSASDIEPIQTLYKTQVYQLARYLDVPQRIIDRAPSANLWENQTDEGEFGFTYKEADEVLYQIIDLKRDVRDVGDVEKLIAEKIIKRVKQNEFKHKTPYIIV